MSDQPIALGGGPIALGSTNTTLGSTNSPSVVDHKPKENGDSKMNEEKPKPTFRFADEVKIGDETLFTIPVEHIFYEENTQRKRKSRWGERPDLKKSNVLFSFLS